jgi:hypothetical protein
MSYRLNETCAICLNDSIMCPYKYRCDHAFCTKCIFSNRSRHMNVVKVCPLCRKIDTNITWDSSPITRLTHTDQVDEFLRSFVVGDLIQHECNVDLIGKDIVLKIRTVDEKKSNSESVVYYIGNCSRVSSTDMVISDCYFLSVDKKFFPCTPITKNIKFGMDEVTTYVSSSQNKIFKTASQIGLV